MLKFNSFQRQDFTQVSALEIRAGKSATETMLEWVREVFR